MSTVPETLREAREAQQLTIQQVAEITKLRSDHVRALEDGNYDVFAAPVYIHGFVRTYAMLLKLDVKQTMAALEVELGRSPRLAEPPPLSPESKGVLDLITLQLSKIDLRLGIKLASVAIVCGLVVLGYLGWRSYHKSDPLRGLKPGMYHETPAAKAKAGPAAAPAPAPVTRK